MRHYGNGLTKADVNDMTFDELNREADRLHKALKAEAEAKKEASRRAASAARRRK